MAVAGTRPGKGVYTCTLCGEKVELKDDMEKLPLCPRCFAATYNP